MRKILCVCTGNICRSPTAEGVLRHYFAQAKKHQMTIDSAGTHGYHTGEAPDPRTVKVAARQGVDLTSLRARKLVVEDFVRQDVILAMDRTHLSHIEHMAKHAPVTAEIALFLPYAGITHTRDVPDPYYGTLADFEAVFLLIEEAVKKVVERFL